VIVVFFFISSAFSLHTINAQLPEYVPTSIKLTALPQLISPQESGIIVIQLVNGQGIPEPVSSAAGSTLTVDLYSSNPAVISVDARAQIPYGASHAEVHYTALGVGTATITAVANGLNAGRVNITSSAVPSYSLRILLSPLQRFAAPGDMVPVLLQLMAGNTPFITPVPVQAFVATSISGSFITTVEVQPGSSFAYFDVVIPNIPSSLLQITAIADGFQSNSTTISVVTMGSGSPYFALLASNDTVYQSGATIQLSVSLLSSSFQPVEGSASVQISSSNQSVILPLVGSLTITGDSAIFQARTGAAGTAELTVLAPGLTSFPLKIKVVNAYGGRLIVDAPTVVRAGENYSFSAELVGDEGILLPYKGLVTVSAYSNATSVLNITAGQFQLASGYGLGTFVATGVGSANITVVVNGYQAGLASVLSYKSPLVANVTYEARVLSRSGPIAGVPINFTYGNVMATVTTNATGIASFTAYNDTPTTITVPKVFQPSVDTKYVFLGIWNSSSNVINVTAQTTTAVFNVTYATYYMFQVTSSIGSTTGSGWYTAGSTAYYSVSKTSSGGPLVFQRFAGWTGSFLSSQPSGSTVITSPESITAQWRTDDTLLFAIGGAVVAVAAVIGAFVFRLRKKAVTT